MRYDNSKGTVVEIQSSYYKVKLEDGTDIPNAQNASSVDIAVGDKVVVSYVDSLTNPIITSVYDKTAGVSKDELKEVLFELKENLQQELLERDHPVGSPYFTFLKDDDPNERYPGTAWVLIDEDTYLVSAGINRPGASPVGSNTHSLTTAEMASHTHTQNSHTHTGSTASAGGHTHTINYAADAASGTARNRPTATGESASQFGMSTSGAHTHTITNTSTTASNQNTGGGQAHNNMPKSIAIYIWRRIL